MRRLGQFWACDRLRHVSRGPSLWASLVIVWVFARRVKRLRQLWACDWLIYFSRYPSLWPSLVSSGSFPAERGVSGNFRACVRLGHMSQGPSFWPSLVIEWVYARRVWSLRLFFFGGHSLAGAFEWIIARHSDAFLRHSGHIPLLSNFSIRRPVAAVPIVPPQRRLFSLVMELGRIWY